MEEAPFVIIGGGISGITCAKSINFLSPDSKVILITSNSLIKTVENVIPIGKVSIQLKISETNPSEFENPSLKIINSTVISINPTEKTITTSDKQSIKYNKLCICTGARPRLISGNPLVLGIRDTESVENFSNKLKKAGKILVVGNGGIATEIVYKIENIDIVWAIKDRHISAGYVDAGAAEFFQSKLIENDEKLINSTKRKKLKIEKIPRNDEKVPRNYEKIPRFEKIPRNDEKIPRNDEKIPRNDEKIPRIEKIPRNDEKIPRIDEKTPGPALGPDWRDIFESRGNSNSQKSIQIEYSCEVSKILTPEDLKDDKYPIYAELTNGKIIGCDLIVSATGVIPNTEIKGLEILKKGEDGGILVDWKLETSEKDIFAAGDCCTANWELSDHWFQMRLWTQAYQMGSYAAKSMVSTLKNEEFLQDFCFELFTHVTQFFGYKIVLLGLYNGQKLSGDYEILLRMTKDVEYIKLVIKDGKLQGAVLIGDTDLEEMCENLILNQLDVSIYGEDLLNPDIDIEDYFD